MVHTVKGFGIVNKAEVDVFLELLLLLFETFRWGMDRNKGVGPKVELYLCSKFYFSHFADSVMLLSE